MSPQSKVAVAATKVAKLSHRQTQILLMIADGLYQKEMADKLHLHLATTSYHVNRVFKTLGVDNNSLATRAAVMAGLVD